MINFAEMSWVVDTAEMTCRDNTNKIVVKIQKEGDVLRGKIFDMPMDLFAEIAKDRNGEKIIEKIVKKAQEEYLRVSSKEE